MKKLLLVMLCLGVVGCASFPSLGCSQFEEQVIKLQGDLLAKDQEIARMQKLCDAKDDQIKGKDSKIEQLRKKLEGFGAF